jgi:hypothetical protein
LTPSHDPTTTSHAPPVRRFRADAAAAALLVLLDLGLYRKVLRLFWTYDDPNILRTLFDYRLIEVFTNGRVWPQQLFTPLMMVAFRGQLALFGLDPSRWYALHLAFAALTTLTVYAAVRQFLRPLPSFSAAAMFTAGVPFCSVVTQLSTIHYFIAIFFCALASIVFVTAIRRSSTTLGCVSAFLYLLAMLAKEVAVPLPLLLLALPVGLARSRARRLIGHGVAVIVYLVWRYAVIGTLLGAYSWKIDWTEWPALLAMLPWRIVQGLAGTGVAVGLTLVATMLIVLVAVAARRRHAMLLVLAGAIVVVGPILPVAKEVNRRYVLVPWLGFSIACAAAAAQRGRRQATVLLALMPILTVAANRQEWRDEFGLRLRMSDEAKVYFVDLPENGLLRAPATSAATLADLRWLRIVHLGQPAGPSWFFDDLYLCTHDMAGKRVWEYVPGLRMVVETTSRMERLAARHCGSLRLNAPLRATFHYRKPALYWDLGPYSDGRYIAIIGDGLQVTELPRREALNLPGVTNLTIRIRYESPRGWSTYSPEIALDLSRNSDVTWAR